MTKPEKKVFTMPPSICTDTHLIEESKKIAYNQAIDDYEKFLPNKKELFDIMLWKCNKEEAAKAIARRIGK